MERLISRAFAMRLFEGFSIQRWNDRIRPFDLTEMDKAGHKMMLAYFLGKMEEARGASVDWDKIIYGGFFDLLKKIVLSDIKASVHRKIAENHPDEFRRLNEWVVQQYEHLLDARLYERLIQNSEPRSTDPGMRILLSAHRYSTLREFELIKGLNLTAPDILRLEKELNADVAQYANLHGIQQLLAKQSLYELNGIVEQLRFQVRWGQTPRVPKTSVLGHSMLVACLALVLTSSLSGCQQRLHNNFFRGLFHDLPEAVTRDIISPVKKATEKLPDIIKEIEDQIVGETLLPKYDTAFREDLVYLTDNEFKSKVIIDSVPQIIDSPTDFRSYDKPAFNPVDGPLIKFCDELAAFLEAERSIAYGISSDHLQMGRISIYNKYRLVKDLYGLDLRRFFAEFSL